uniref:Uncharacterized protein n=1 Tax=Arundo donax TaxID=35708 RepID=A0A0A9FJM8_ARUDO
MWQFCMYYHSQQFAWTLTSVHLLMVTNTRHKQ